MNIKADGTVPTTASDGLNPVDIRPTQIYSYPLNIPAATATFSRLGVFPSPSTIIASTQLIPSNSIRRMAFNLALTEFGTGNFDLQTEVYYFIEPTVTSQATVTNSIATGATALPILPTAVPTPTISPSPTQQPSPTPTPTPTPTPGLTPSPTPITPAAVLGISPGMLAIDGLRIDDWPYGSPNRRGFPYQELYPAGRIKRGYDDDKWSRMWD